MINRQRLYPLRSQASHLDKAEQIVREAADSYNLSLLEIRATPAPGGPRKRGGLVFAARVDAARRCLRECIRPGYLAIALGIHPRVARRYYRLLRAAGFGPLCMRRAS